MRPDIPIYLNAVAVELGELQTAESALAAGVYPWREARRSEQRSVSVASTPAPELAVAAARRALTTPAARHVPPVGLHLHSSILYSGLDFWSASCYVADQLGLRELPFSASFSAMSNSAIAALDLAATILCARSDVDTALLTVGDRFGDGSGFAHWHADSMPYGDAGAAALLSTTPGVARVLATASLCDPSLEGLHRGTEPFRTASTACHTPLDVYARKRAWLRRHGAGEFDRVHSTRLVAVVKQALADAEVDLDDLTYILTPFYGRHAVHQQCLAPLGIDEHRTLTDLGLTVGHLGASDHLAGLAELLRTGAVSPGDKVLLASIGVGFTFTAAVLDITTTAEDTS